MFHSLKRSICRVVPEILLMSACNYCWDNFPIENVSIENFPIGTPLLKPTWTYCINTRKIKSIWIFTQLQNWFPAIRRTNMLINVANKFVLLIIKKFSVNFSVARFINILVEKHINHRLQLYPIVRFYMRSVLCSNIVYSHDLNFLNKFLPDQEGTTN